jgi:CDP-diacylglycerol--glycerol-3-phosphate 3-phosphatidyltransferase
MVSGIRLVAIERGKVIAAGKSGKLKTAFTMIAIFVIFIIGGANYTVTNIISQVLIYIATLLTLYSGFEYLYKNREIVFESI